MIDRRRENETLSHREKNLCPSSETGRAERVGLLDRSAFLKSISYKLGVANHE